MRANLPSTTRREEPQHPDSSQFSGRLSSASSRSRQPALEMVRVHVKPASDSGTGDSLETRAPSRRGENGAGDGALQDGDARRGAQIGAQQDGDARKGAQIGAQQDASVKRGAQIGSQQDGDARRGAQIGAQQDVSVKRGAQIGSQQDGDARKGAQTDSTIKKGAQIGAQQDANVKKDGEAGKAQTGAHKNASVKKGAQSGAQRDASCSDSARFGARKDDAASGEGSDPPARTDEEKQSPRHLTTMCCKNARHKAFFLLVLGMDVLDLFTDWLLYIDLRIKEPGLVYGPPEEPVLHALLAFSIVGTITFVLETVNLWRAVFRRKACLDVDLVSMLVIWVEDLPQIAINFHIARCREDPISIFQLFKASIVLVELLVRIIISLVKYCSKTALREAKDHSPESRRHLVYRIFVVLGLLCNAALAIGVFIFTQTQRGADGSILFQVPKTLFEDKYNDQRYFQNVSVFIHHPDFDAIQPDRSTNFQASWLRFTTLNDIRDPSNADISYNYIHEKTSSHLKMALFVKEDNARSGQQSDTWRLTECYQKVLPNGQITAVSSGNCTTNFFTRQASSMYIVFSFKAPARFFRKLIFGDILFNAKIYENQECQEYNNFTSSIKDDATIPSIHYYRTNATIAPGNLRHLLNEDGGAPRFYRSDGRDLQDIEEVWQTGWNRCKSSGSLAPHFDSGVPVQCSNKGAFSCAR